MCANIAAPLFSSFFTECDQTFVSRIGGPQNGSFSAPLLHNHRNHSRQCLYTFLAGPGQRVEVVFKSFNLRGSPPEWVQIEWVEQKLPDTYIFSSLCLFLPISQRFGRRWITKVNTKQFIQVESHHNVVSTFQLCSWVHGYLLGGAVVGASGTDQFAIRWSLLRHHSAASSHFHVSCSCDFFF